MPGSPIMPAGNSAASSVLAFLPGQLRNALAQPPGVTASVDGELPPKIHTATRFVSDGIATERTYKSLDVFTGIGTWLSNEAKFGGAHLAHPVTEWIRALMHGETKHSAEASVWWQFIGSGIGAVLNDIPKAYGYAVSTVYMMRARQSLAMGDLADDPYEKRLVERMIQAYLLRSPFIIGEKVLQSARFFLLGAAVLAGGDTLAESFLVLLAAKGCGISATFGNWYAMGPAVERTRHEKRVLRAREDGKTPAKIIHQYLENTRAKAFEAQTGGHLTPDEAETILNGLQSVQDECFAEAADVSARLMDIERRLSLVEAPLERGLFAKGADILLMRENPSPEKIEEQVAALAGERQSVLGRYHADAALFLAKTHVEAAKINRALAGIAEPVALPDKSSAAEVLKKWSQHLTTTAEPREEDARRILAAAFANESVPTDGREAGKEMDRRLNLAQISAAFNGFYDAFSSAMYHGLTIFYTMAALRPGELKDILNTAEAHAASIVTGTPIETPAVAGLHELNAVLGGAIEFPSLLMIGLTVFSMIGPSATFYNAVKDRIAATKAGKMTDRSYFGLSMTSEGLKFGGLSIRYLPILRPFSLVLLGVGAYFESIMHRWHDKSRRGRFMNFINAIRARIKP